MLHGIAMSPGMAIEIGVAADAFMGGAIAQRSIGRTMRSRCALHARTARAASWLLGVGAVGIGQTLDAKTSRAIAIRLHWLAGRAVGAARHAPMFADVANLRGITMCIEQAFHTDVTIGIAIGLGFGAARIGQTLHASAARAAEMLGTCTIGVRQALDTGGGDGIAIRGRRRAFAIASARFGRLLGPLGGVVGNEVDGAGIPHRTMRDQQSDRTPSNGGRSEPRRLLRRREGDLESSEEHAIHPYRYK